MTDLYLHLLNGEIAQYDERDGRLAYEFKRITKFATSLRQIRREQEKSKGFYGDPTDRYEYIRVARSALRRGL